MHQCYVSLIQPRIVGSLIKYIIIIITLSLGLVTLTLQILVISGYLDVARHIQIGMIILITPMIMLICVLVA